jgi:Excalibur calcium-binding domain
VSAHRAHRRVRPARPAVAGRVALSGAAVLTLGAGPFVGMAAAAPTAAVDYNCADFTYQEDAQAKLLPGDPYRLDADHDGVACESYAYSTHSASAVRSVANTADTSPTVPVGAVAAGDGSTDGGSGMDVLWYGLLGTAAVAGAAGAHQFVGGHHRRRA